ncbi:MULTISPECIES: TetR family transcriptional regulator [Acetobacter]|uniref:TetR family transcriptional regulator n=1 Tax=Acetobacter thailandicus TaxID=1502842 RepID=A0ABT3QEC0_9PROT|nr:MULTISPECIES: TetR family transcriptional regulator [Acetobacter]MBS0960644.1 TetR family transcriptional regulator [Acetobacter thailandicus]MBS0986167.1 TetR family transcriptional regulator [Acetobacter thailandicus]MBS1004068.1 TetR family transcriptional regulator [Acetobacter thailandicus]MCX2563594.1 TetR family transcriptional regulator [Acetobacter thailandicus]NHN94347.1 TetR family transcriptional regulator [Acetobacter thailandicus]
MDTDDFDTTLLNAAMALAAEKGWASVSLLDAARKAELSFSETRTRFPLRSSLLLRLGRLADDSALADNNDTSPARERLFDLLMRRFDVFQIYRDGVRAVLHALPTDPALTLLLSGATFESMRWMTDAAGIPVTGIKGFVNTNIVIGIWTHTLRVWEKDDSEDMSRTMAALDQALDKAARFKLFAGDAAPDDDLSHGSDFMTSGLPEPENISFNEKPDY